MQEIYINLDDSGKLCNLENISVYGGLVFLSKNEKAKFITQYRNIIKDIKCKYCKHICNKVCPEIKNTNILPKDKRRIMNYIKKYYIIALVIENKLVYNHIIESKAAKGRFIDYSIRRLIKEVINIQIKNKLIDAYKPLKVIVNIDEQVTKSNGYYNLHDGIVEELKYGISNYNYEMSFNPIVFSDLEVYISYKNSKYSYVIQASDLLAGTIRKISLKSGNTINIKNNLKKLVNYQILLP